MNRLPHYAAALLCLVATTTLSTSGRAQAGPPEPVVPAPGGAPMPSPSPSPQPSPTPGSTYVPTQGQFGFGFGNPQSSDGRIGGGNANDSSSLPRTGSEEDTFDFGKGGGSQGAAHGDSSSPVFTARGGMRMEAPVPTTHTVRRGDTLWGLCDHYFSNPYQWPRVWSYNPQVKNPNWIYPGDELRLRAIGAGGATPEPQGRGGGASDKFNLVDRRGRVPHDTVFLRDQGWIRDESDELWGEVSGSGQDTMFLSDLNEVYLDIKKGHEPHVGQELTVFRTRQTALAGNIVQILGTVRVDAYNDKQRVARAQVIETLDTIERGAKVGPLARSFIVVPPATDETDVKARVLASLRPNQLYGQNQVVFIDKGEAAGLKPGNRLLIQRRGDAWRQSLVDQSATYRISPDDERPMPPLERTPGADDSRFPQEVTAELRVLTTKKDTSACLVINSRLEIEPGDVAYARKGY